MSEQLYLAQEEQHKVLRSLIGRERELQYLYTFLSHASPWMLRIIGQGGMGKSTLLRAIEQKYHSSDVLVVGLNLAESDVTQQTETQYQIDLVSLLSYLASAVRSRCDRDAWQDFATVQSRVRWLLMEQMTVSASYTQNMHLKAGAVAERNQLVMRFDDASRLQEQQRQGTELVFEAFRRLMETFNADRLIVTIDTCECLNEPANEGIWLTFVQRMLHRLYNDLAQRGKQCHVILASNRNFFLPTIADEEQSLLTLTELGQEAVYQKLEQAGIQNAELCKRIYQMTYGIAACVTLVCKIWQDMPDEKKVSSATNFPVLQETFYERAMDEYIANHVFKRRPWPPYDKLSRYSALLHRFTMPLLTRMFPEIFQALDEMQRQECFDEFVHLPHIKGLGNHRFKVVELVRAVLAIYILGREPDVWDSYHKRAVEIMQTAPELFALRTCSAEWYYHSLATKLFEGEGAVVTHWQQALLETASSSKHRAALLEAVHDETLLLTAVARAAQSYEQMQSSVSGEDGSV